MGTGIEPVFTDLQSNPFHFQINAVKPEKYQDKSRTGGERDTRPRNAMALYAKPAHKAVARDLCYVLTLGDEAAWSGFATVCKARLTDAENAAAAIAHLLTLDPDQRDLIFEAFQPVKDQDANLHVDPLDCAAFRDAVADYRQQRGRGRAA